MSAMNLFKLLGAALLLTVSVCKPKGCLASDSPGPVGARPEVEPEVRRRFDYWEKKFPYRVDDPVYTVVYSEEQKQAQRKAAQEIAGALKTAAANAKETREFTIPEGIYRIEPGQIELKEVSNFTIHAPGVELIVDGEKSGPAFAFVSCTNVTLTGRAKNDVGQNGAGALKPLIVDSQQLPMSVAKIVSVNIKELTLDIEVLPGYATDLPESERMMAYDTKGRLLNVEQMGWKGLEKTGESRFRLTTASLRRAENREKILIPGTLLALHNNAHHGARTHSVFSNHNCANMTFESIRVYNGGGAPADHGTAGTTVFRDWRLFPRPGTNRLPIATGLGQFSKNGGTFVFENCEFGPHLDDGINLLSGMSIVGKSIDDKQLVVTGWQQPTVGSTLSFYDYNDWHALGEAKVLASESVAAADTLADVNAFAKRNRTVQNARNAFRTTLDRPVKLTPFAMTVHSDYRADSIVVRGCLFRDQLAQIMLLQGCRSGLIENNLLLRSTGAAVSAQFAQYWWEGPMPENLTIRNNVIRDNPVAAAVNGLGASASIAVYAGTNHPTDARLLHNFRIENNTIVNPSVYGIAIRNADGVVIRNNRIVNPGACAVTGTYNGRPIAELYAAITLDAVSRAEVTDNEIVFGNPRCHRAVLMEPNCDAPTVKVERNHELLETSGSYANPIIQGDYADPSIVRVGEDYYLTHSSFSYVPGLLIWHSRDLVNWEPMTYALHQYDGDVWAPDLVRHDGKFFIYYYTGGGNGVPRGMRVVSAPRIEGPWSDPIDLHLGNIDPGHLATPDGKRFLFLSSGNIVELAADGLSAVGVPKQVYEGWPIPESWRIEGFCPESPKLLFKDGWYHLFTAQGGTAGPSTSHMIVHARSRSPFGPWENSPFNPIVHTAAASEQWWSRGHGTLIDTPSGEWWMLYHGYDREYKTLGRQTLLEPMRWTADGWLKSKVGDPSGPISTPNLAPFAVKWLDFKDDFSGPSLAPFWRAWEGTDPSRFSCRSGTLEMRAFGETPGQSRPLVLITGDHSYRIETEVELAEGARAGLILFYNPVCYAALECSERGVRCGFQGKMGKGYQLAGAKRWRIALVFDRNEVDFLAAPAGEVPKKLWGSVDVSGYNHNTFGGFLSLRPGLFSCGEGKALFQKFLFSPL